MSCLVSSSEGCLETEKVTGVRGSWKRVKIKTWDCMGEDGKTVY